MDDIINKSIQESLKVKKELFQEIDSIHQVSQLLINAYKRGNKLLVAGNGGSAADAQHFIAEIVGKYKMERKGLPGIALTTNTSILTAIGNDYGYEHVFRRQIEAQGEPGDIFIAISTSGNSENLITALEEAKKNKIITIGLLGNNGGKMGKLCDYNIIIPSKNTPRIQEMHIFVIHVICESFEKELFEKRIKN